MKVFAACDFDKLHFFINVSGTDVLQVFSNHVFLPCTARSTNHRPAESSVSTGSSASSFGSGYSMDSEGSSSATGENNLFPIPRM